MVKILSLLLFLSFGLGVLSMSPVQVHAQTKEFCDGPQAQATEFCRNQSAGTSTNNTIVGPNGIMTRLVNVLSMIVGAAAVIVVIIGGLMFVVANGDSSQINKARQTIIYGLVGLVVAIFARAIVAFVLNRL